MNEAIQGLGPWGPTDLGRALPVKNQLTRDQGHTKFVMRKEKQKSCLLPARTGNLTITTLDITMVTKCTAYAMFESFRKIMNGC